MEDPRSLERRHPFLSKLLWKRSPEKIPVFPRKLLNPSNYLDLDPILQRLFFKRYPPAGMLLLKHQKKASRARAQAQTERGRRRLLHRYVNAIQGYDVRRSVKALVDHSYYSRRREKRFSAVRFLLKDPKFYERGLEFQQKTKQLARRDQKLPQDKKWSLVFYLQWVFYSEEYYYLRGPRAARDTSRIHQRLRRLHRLRQLIGEKERSDQRVTPEDVAEFFDMIPYDYELLLRRVGRFKRASQRLPFLFWALQYLFLFLNKPYKKIPMEIQLRELREASSLSFSRFQQLLELDGETTLVPLADLRFHQCLWGEWLVSFAGGKKNPPHFIKKNYLKNLENAEHLSDYFFLIFHDKLPPETEAFPRYRSTLELLRAKARWIQGKGYHALPRALWEEEMVSFWKLTLKTLIPLRRHQALLVRLSRKQQKAAEEQRKAALAQQKAAEEQRKAALAQKKAAAARKKKAPTKKKELIARGKVRPSARRPSRRRRRL